MSTESSRFQQVAFQPRRPALRRVLAFDSASAESGPAFRVPPASKLGEEDMSTENPGAAGTPARDIPIDWEALQAAFENNAPEVHSYLHLVTGDVLRVVDG